MGGKRGEKKGSRHRSVDGELDMDMGLPEGVTWEALDERARRVAKALMGDSGASGEGGQERS